MNLEKEIIQKEHKFLQFELWADCKNGCDFCYNRFISTSVSKINSLKKTLCRIKNVEFCDTIGLIGGEFFDGQMKENEYLLFTKVILEISKKIKEEKVNRLLIATSLIFESTRFDEFLQYLKELNIEKNVVICTSYDTIYRFKNNGLTLWENNVRKINSTNIKTHIELIVTHHFIQQVLSGQFDIGMFSEKYAARLDFIEPTVRNFKNKEQANKIIPLFLPRKKEFISFLVFLNKKGWLTKDFLSSSLRSNTIFYYDSRDGRTFTSNRQKYDPFSSSYFYDCEESILEVTQQFKKITGLL